MILSAIIISSCSSAPPPRPVVDVEPAKETYNKGSLWPGKNKNNMFFADNKASRVGDIVTVHVIEKTVALNKANTTDKHAVNDKLKIDTGGATPTSISLGGGLSYAGKGATGRSDQFSATVSCLVTEVLANGNMTIEGQRRMQINDEEQYILIKGIVRPDDITYDNSVISSKIAQADIRYTGEGAFNSAKHPNWLSRTLRNVWPF